MAEVYPGAYNVFTPAFARGAASDQLMVEYSRNPSKFTVNKYTQLRPVENVADYYARMNTEYATRVVSTADHVWPETNDRPRGKSRPHQFILYRTQRYAEGFTVGRLTKQMAPWDIIASHARGASTLMMTLRTINAVTELTTAGNWDGNTDTASNVGGGKWDVSSGTNKYVQKTVQAVIENVAFQTGGAVGADDLMVVISPNVAHQIAQSPEILQYIINHDAAIAAWQGTDIFNTYGLPPNLWGVQVVIEDAVRTTTRAGLTATTGYIMGNFAAFVARPGDLVGVENAPEAPTLSTLSCFIQEDMTVETKDDDWQRRIEGSVVDNYVYELTAPNAGYLVSAVVD